VSSVLVVRKGPLLYPADGLAEEEIVAFPLNRNLICALKESRSGPNLRHYFACLTALARAIGMEDPARGKDALHDMLKIDCGLVTAIKTNQGGLRLVADSVAFDKLKGGEPEFIDFKRRAFDVCKVNFGVDPVTLSREGSALLGNLSGGNFAKGQQAEAGAAGMPPSAGDVSAEPGSSPKAKPKPSS
jgi:hypothetical protein